MIGPRSALASPLPRSIPASGTAASRAMDGSSHPDFAATLMRYNMRQQEGPIKAAAILPAIGSSARSFAASPLLTATAVASSLSDTQNTVAISPTVAAPTASGGELPVALGNAIALLVSRISDAIGEIASASTATRSMGQTPATKPAAEMEGASKQAGLPPAVFAASPKICGGSNASVEAEGPPASRAALPAQRTAGGGAWTVHCLPIEGGIRLLIRLARLSDDTRSELENRLHDLVRQFGLKLHELDLWETPPGGS